MKAHKLKPTALWLILAAVGLGYLIGTINQKSEKPCICYK